MLSEISVATYTVPAGARHLLGFDEPDRVDQANLTLAAAVALWPKIERLARRSWPRLLIGSPSVASSLSWLATFLDLCARQNCTVDFITFHAYRSTSAAFIGSVQEVHARFPSWPLWISEFGYGFTQDPKNTAKALQMHTESTQWMDSQLHSVCLVWHVHD